jgi:predicted kinase
VTRKALEGLGPLERLPSGAYTPKQSARVYRHLLEAAATSLAAGQSVVLDAVYARPAERFAVEALAARMGVPFHGIWLDAPEETRAERVDVRTGDASDAGPSVAASQSSYDLGPMRWTRVDGARGVEAVLEEARSLLSLDPEPQSPL